MTPILGLLCLLSFLSLPHQGLGTSRNQKKFLKCDNIISRWLANLSVSETPENATLTVHWNGLGQTLSQQGCPVKHLSLELWRVDPNSQPHRPEDFGSFEYFSAFERCNKLVSLQVRAPIIPAIHIVTLAFIFKKQSSRHSMKIYRAVIICKRVDCTCRIIEKKDS